MYIVKVYEIDALGGKNLVDTKRFMFGEWQEIAYWLDERFYIKGDTFLEIEMQEESCTS